MNEQPLAVFVHIPNAAGTTLKRVLVGNFPGGVRSLGNCFGRHGGFDRRAILRIDEAIARAHDSHAVSGKLPFGIRDRLPAGSRFVTLLRDPVERTLSQYNLLATTVKTLPGDGSLEAVLAAGDLIYDNLQTRMLSDAPEPIGEVDEQMLEEAKENLRSGFAAFGIVERFDESLVLLAEPLGIESLLYVQERVSDRDRGADVAPAALRAAQGANEIDAELYRFAVDLFDQRVAEQGAEFHVDVAAVRAAREGERSERPTAPTLPCKRGAAGST